MKKYKIINKPAGEPVFYTTMKYETCKDCVVNKCVYRKYDMACKGRKIKVKV